MRTPMALCALLAALTVILRAEESRGVARSTRLDGAKIHYTEYGAGENALLFVHGWSCDETFWVGQAPALGARFHVITIVWPGRGKSERPHIAYTMDLYARAIDAVLRDAKVQAAT